MKKSRYILALFFLISSCNPTAKVPERPEVPAAISEKPKNIILLIGNGMGLSQISAAAIANGGELNMFRFSNIGMVTTHSADNLITDGGAGATAIATGHKTFNGGIGVDAEGNSVPNILELAKQKGKSTGLVATSSITHATPAAFVAHINNRSKEEEIALAFLDAGIDVFIGGGMKYFDKRTDKRSLTDELRKKGYKTPANYEKLRTERAKKLAGFIADGDPPRAEADRGDFLEMAWLKSYSILNKNKEGYFLMVEGSQIGWGGHSNRTGYVISELLEFDKIAGQALNFAMADGETLVIITGTYESGGMAINGGSLEKKTVEAGWAGNTGTGTMLPIFAYGPGAENFRGVFDNTDIFHKMKMLFID